MNTNMNIDPSYEYEGIDEDDTFYAEIRRQILLLTTDDDEDYQETKILHSVRASKLGSNRAVGNISSSSQYGSYFSLWESENTNSVPTWLANLWRNGNGTGVFIPHINKSRRRHRPGRMDKRILQASRDQTIMNKQSPLRVQQAGNCTSQSEYLISVNKML
ncbi:hypothetical protein CRYUN_Cryun21dG0003100 [Craigia yunnanensis]